MAGHSKWAQIKHKKAKEDAKRGKIFSKLTRAIIVAAKQGGGNPETNPQLANAIEKAKQFNLPQENIERAIKKATGELGSENYEQIVYEGYAPGGVAVMVETMTDNRNRTAADIRHIFSKHGGNLSETGSVSWMFEKKGIISFLKEKVNEEELLMDALEAGAEDLEEDESFVNVITSPKNFNQVKEVLKSKNYKFERAEITMTPTSTVRIEDKETAKKIIRLIEALEDHDDVQEVYSNFDIKESILDELED
ncbi:MAG: YebC/PmpR family DNA-binding transcriptional regulator [Actinobacteria bacterium]|nr:YebC/PmpR family DNA-binding transcriptional regulator [Actinomycetota bacterium]